MNLTDIKNTKDEIGAFLISLPPYSCPRGCNGEKSCSINLEQLFAQFRGQNHPFLMVEVVEELAETSCSRNLMSATGDCDKVCEDQLTG